MEIKCINEFCFITLVEFLRKKKCLTFIVIFNRLFFLLRKLDLFVRALLVDRSHELQHQKWKTASRNTNAKIQVYFHGKYAIALSKKAFVIVPQLHLFRQYHDCCVDVTETTTKSLVNVETITHKQTKTPLSTYIFNLFKSTYMFIYSFFPILTLCFHLI